MIAYPIVGMVVVPHTLGYLLVNFDVRPAARTLARGAEPRLIPGCGVGRERQGACWSELYQALRRRPHLVPDLLKDRDPDVLKATLAVVDSTALKANETRIFELLAHSETSVRWHAAKRLFEEANPAHNSIWLSNLDNESYVVRRYAVQALLQQGVPPSPKMLAAVPPVEDRELADHRLGRLFFEQGLLRAGLDPYSSASP